MFTQVLIELRGIVVIINSNPTEKCYTELQKAKSVYNSGVSI
jgi:hypothetical protein